MECWVRVASARISYLKTSTPFLSSSRLLSLKPARCTSRLQEVQNEQVDSGILCEPCNGKGWLVCDFCNGKKANVQAKNKRVFRRCPSCRAIGYVLCSKCRVFKCVTFPNCNDGEELSF